MAACFAAALLLRTAAVLILRTDPMDGIDSGEYDRLARDLLAGQGLGLLQGYVRPPLYPLLVAGTYALGGIAVLIAVQVLLGSLATVLVGELASRLADDRRAGIAAAVAAAIYPWSFQWVGTLASENLFTPLALLAFVAVIHAADARPHDRSVTAGVLFGVAALARNNILVLVGPIALWWLWRSRQLVRPTFFACGLVVGLVPFAVYEAAAGNGLVLGSSGGGLIFYAGNNPDASRLYGGDLSDQEWRDLNRRSALGPAAYEFSGCAPDSDTVTCVTDVPPREREAFWYRAAWRYISTRPAEWALLEARKLTHYWRPWVDPRAYSAPVVLVSGLSFGAIVVLAVIGTVKMRRENAGFVAAVAIGATIASVGWLVQLRYRTALLDPVLIAATGPALLWMIEGGVSRLRTLGVTPPAA